MVCHGPDPPENNPYELTPPARHDLMIGTVEDSDEDNEHIGYEPLPQEPEAVLSDHDSDDESENTNTQPVSDVPSIESMDTTLTRTVWNTPRPEDPIQMDNEKAQQFRNPMGGTTLQTTLKADFSKLVMTAMANFVLPQTSIPEWAQSITEDQWKQTLHDRIEKLKNK